MSAVEIKPRSVCVVSNGNTGMHEDWLGSGSWSGPFTRGKNARIAGVLDLIFCSYYQERGPGPIGH